MTYRLDRNSVWILEGRLAADESYELMTEQTFYTATELLHDSILSCNNRLEVKTVGQSCHTESLRLKQPVQHFGILAERLRRDAALVQTCSSDMPGLDQHDLDSPLRSQQCGLISARPRTYDYNLHNTQFQSALKHLKINELPTYVCYKMQQA